ncbi:MAG: tRNA preQ1(34) S-adenosylmethionine ribosyltransferase-isomerase QueA, partial [Planctomycetales bacterium]|nr:tRNA preQ1(34) S-adenosylmethionine ribosyltransferase-isomerase QueA [Planctomycetales bacterium]
LFEERLGWVRDRPSVARVTLDTSQHTVAFFERFGFRTTRVTRDHYAPGLHRHDMELVLDLSPFRGLVPSDRIAQRPAEPRDSARLLVLERATGAIAHRVVRDLPALLRAGDLLVLNATRVIPVRLAGARSTGGRVKLLLIPPRSAGEPWECYAEAGGRLAPGEALSLPEGTALRLVEHRGGGRWRMDAGAADLAGLCERHGRAPLPPYIKRPGEGDPDAAADRERYQTVFAREPGAVAAPTAGLHFTPDLLARCRAGGIATAEVILHVGPGTFAPERAPGVGGPEPERCRVPRETAEAVAACRTRGGRVVAVGTTTVRSLEWAAAPSGRIEPREGLADNVIAPGHGFRAVDALLTNFHLPDGGPLRLTAAFAGAERLLAAYRAAIVEGYRFCSYGDAMLIL